MNCQFLEHQFEAVIAHVVQINDAHHVRKEVPSDCQPYTFIIVELYVDLHACTHMNDTKNPGMGHTQHTLNAGDAHTPLTASKHDVPSTLSTAVSKMHLHSVSNTVLSSFLRCQAGRQLCCYIHIQFSLLLS